MMEIENIVTNFAGWIKLSAETISILLIAAGILVTLYRILQNIRRPDIIHYNQARLTFTRYLVMALEFMLAADIVATAIRPTWEDLSMLVAIAVIRTFLNFFLQREMKEEEREVENAREHVRG